MDKTQFEHLIDIGIKREEEAHSFYQFAGSRINNRAIKKIFHELATEELNHKELLLQFKQNPALHARLQAPSVEYFLAEETELPKLHQDMKPADALALAMKKEQQAVEFYKRLASNMEDPEMRKLCLDIAKMEMKHKHKLENAYTDIAYIEAF